MIDIHSATTEIRRGKKKKEQETGQKYNVRNCHAGRQCLMDKLVGVDNLRSFHVA